MKLFTSDRAPNPERVRMYLAEKGIDLETEFISLQEGQQFSAEFRAINPDCVVPALALDDGTAITESLAICRYLEVEHPSPPLFGVDAPEVGRVEMWLRRVELQGYLPTQDAYRNGHPGFAGRALPGARGDVAQLPALVTRANQTMTRMLDGLDPHLGAVEYVAGQRFTMADIVLFTTLNFGRRTRFEAVSDLSRWPRLARWHRRIQTRPSAAADVSRD